MKTLADIGVGARLAGDSAGTRSGHAVDRGHDALFGDTARSQHRDRARRHSSLSRGGSRHGDGDMCADTDLGERRRGDGGVREGRSRRHIDRDDVEASVHGREVPSCSRGAAGARGRDAVDGGDDRDRDRGRRLPVGRSGTRRYGGTADYDSGQNGDPCRVEPFRPR